MIEPSRWSNDTETIRQRILSKTDTKLVEQLTALKAFLISEEKLFTGTRSKDWLQTLIDKFNGIDKDGEDINSYISNFIKRIDSGEIKTIGAINYVKGVVRSFKGFQGVFNRYQGIYTDKEIVKYNELKKTLRSYKRIDFRDINMGFYRDFVKYLSDEEYEVNTIGRFIKQLKRIMRQAKREKKHNNLEYEDFAVVSTESHAIYLTLDEIDKIWNYKCEGEREEIARDCFVVLCETGLRISDYRKIEIRGDMIDIYQKKTSGKVVIPLTSRMKEILKKYNGVVPYIHENYVNEYIKTIAFRAGLTDKVTWMGQEKGMKLEKGLPKWSLISCHTGRRSMATNLKKAGVDIKDISTLLGHRSIKTTENYIKTTKYETAEKLSQLPFFNRNLKIV
jgi:integrase